MHKTHMILNKHGCNIYYNRNQSANTGTNTAISLVMLGVPFATEKFIVFSALCFCFSCCLL